MLIGLGDRYLRFRLRQLRTRLFQLALSLRDLPAYLVYRRLEGPGIDLKQQLALFYEATLDVSLLHEIASDLRFDVGVHQPVERADPLAVERNIFLLHWRDFDFQERRCRSRGIATGAADGDYEHRGDRG